MKVRYIPVVAALALMLLGARPMLMGPPPGIVTQVDADAATVAVNLGGTDGVFRGMKFAVVDPDGRQVAVIKADEVYDRLFWSEKLDPESVDEVSVEMQVRWMLTPETSALLSAMKDKTIGGVKGFMTRFPQSDFIPELVRSMPEQSLKDLDPEYYDAWKSYTKESFTGYMGRHAGTGLAKAARLEIKAIEKYEAEEDQKKKEREERAKAWEEERKRQEEITAQKKALDAAARQKELLGRLTNNSANPVRFVFLPPSSIPQTTVKPGGHEDIRSFPGSFKYKVYEVKNPPAPPPAESEEQKADKEGEAQINFDFWEVSYP